MAPQLKILNRRVALATLPALATVMLVGCASSGGHARRDVPEWDTMPYEQQAQRAQMMTHSGDSSAVIFSPGAEADPAWYAYQRQVAPQIARRDDDLGVGNPDPTAGWYNWSLPERPSLGDRAYFSTSRNPDSYAYPSRDRTVSGSGRHRSSGSYSTPRRRVR